METNDKMIQELRDRCKGEVILPGEKQYDVARKIWNGMFDRKPAMIARCLNPDDVVHAVNFARENQLVLSVKGGGHNSAGNAVCDDGMMIDLSLMKYVIVHPENSTVEVQGGALLSDVDKATHAYGLAVSAGIVSHTGVGGLTLGGGFGWISRKYGLTIDNLISARVVTADGSMLTASAKENKDLYWGVRGGGGNFGIVTSFVFKCAKIGQQVFSGLIVKRFEDTPAYLRFHREYVRQLPDEMTVWMVIRYAPPLPFLSTAVHGKMVVVIPFVWLGEPSQGESLIQPIRDVTPSHGEAIGMNSWTDWQSGFDALVEHGARNYWKSHHIKELSDDCIDTVNEYAKLMPSEECEIFIPHMEGFPSRVPIAKTAFAHRQTPFVLNIHTRWQKKEDDETCLGWAKAFHKATEPHAKGVYVNFLSDEGESRVKEAYTEEIWAQLIQIKNKYDPHNLFRMNQNIKPTC